MSGAFQWLTNRTNQAKFILLSRLFVVYSLAEADNSSSPGRDIAGRATSGAAIEVAVVLRSTCSHGN